MLRFRAELSIVRALLFFAAGVLAGIQIALYLFDLYDDGVADIRSGIIGVILLLLGVIIILWTFRRSSRNPGE